MTKYLIIPNKDRMQDSLRLAKTYGLGFEFNDFFTPKMLLNEAECGERLKFYEGQDLPEIRTSHGDFFDVILFSEDEEIAAISKKRIRQSMEIGRKLGVRGVIFHTNTEPFLTAEYYLQNWHNKNKEFFGEICKEYPEINVYLENMFDQTPTELKLLAKDMEDVPNFGVCLDYAHASISKTPIETWVKELAPFIRHVHINDNDGIKDLHQAVGDGVTDWEKFLRLKKEFFPEVTVLVEVTLLENQEKSLEYMKEHGFFGE